MKSPRVRRIHEASVVDKRPKGASLEYHTKTNVTKCNNRLLADIVLG